MTFEKTFTAVKSLLGLHDIALGRGSFIQQRGKASVTVSKIEIPLIVPTSSSYDIDAIDVNKFKVLLSLGKVTENDGLGGFFVYDPTDTSSVASNDMLVGAVTGKRFKRLRIQI